VLASPREPGLDTCRVARDPARRRDLRHQGARDVRGGRGSLGLNRARRRSPDRTCSRDPIRAEAVPADVGRGAAQRDGAVPARRHHLGLRGHPRRDVARERSSRPSWSTLGSPPVDSLSDNFDAGPRRPQRIRRIALQFGSFEQSGRAVPAHVGRGPVRSTLSSAHHFRCVALRRVRRPVRPTSVARGRPRRG
jgi:hypothetical protein